MPRREVQSISKQTIGPRDQRSQGALFKPKTGCIWQGEINDFTKHVDDDCQFVDVDCPSGCDTKLKRQCVKDHLNDDCPCYCNTSGHSDWISSRHKEHCDMYPIPCPNRCELGVTRSVGIEEHRKVCPLEVVQCEYHDVGCDIKLARKDIDTHIKNQMATHLDLMRCYLTNTTEELRKTEKKLDTVEKDLEATKEMLDKTKSSYDKLHTRLTSAESQVTGFDTKADKKVKDIGSKFQKSLQEQLETRFDEEQALTKNGALPNFVVSKVSGIFLILCMFVLIYTGQICVINNRLAQTEQRMWPRMLDQASKLSSSPAGQVAPVIFKIANFSKQMDDNETWSSNLFYAFDKGYKMFLTVTSGVRYEKGIIVSLLFMKDSLEAMGYWPLSTMFTVELLNQESNVNHYIVPLMVSNSTCHIFGDFKDLLACSVHFISISWKLNQYLKNDSVFLRVSHDDSLFNVLLWYINWYSPAQDSLHNFPNIFVWLIFVVRLMGDCQEVCAVRFKRSKYGNWKPLRYLVIASSSVIIFLSCLYVMYHVGAFRQFI